MEAEMALGRHAAITGDLHSLVAEHPTRERLTAQLMRALYHSGRQADALDCFEMLRARLVDELGIEPSRELRQLERAVLRQELDDPFSGVPVERLQSRFPRQRGALAADAPVSPGQTPFVGREAERAELARLLQRTLGGQGALVMIGGEPGVGKTRLSQDVAAEGHRRGFLVLTGHCYEAHAGFPYMPLVEIIEGAARNMPLAEFRVALGEAAPEFARLVPQLRQMLPDIPPPLELPPDQQRRYIFSCISDYVARVARTRPRLYVLEDLHWADESTLLLLEHLAERLSTSPVLIIGTYRDPPIDIPPSLAGTLSELVRRRQAWVMSLKRHSEAEVAILLHGLSGHPPPPEVIAAIYAETEGNAFFVEEVFRYLAETGRLLDEGGRLRTDLRIEELDVPENVRLVTGQRLDRLGETTRHMLTAAAVIGRRCNLEVLEAVDEVRGDQLLDAIDEAERARLAFTKQVGRQSYLWFAHELIRQTLLGRLSAPRRQRYHLRVAKALELVHADGLHSHAAEIAEHMWQAGTAADPLRTMHYLALAGDRAQEAAAFEEALRHFGHALSILPADEARRRADLLIKVGLAQRSLCQWNDTVATWNEALTLLEMLGEVDAVASLCWDFCMQFTWANRFAEQQAIAQRGLSVVGDRPGHQARLLAMRAVGRGIAGDFAEAAADIAEAKRLAEGQSDDRLSTDVAFGETVHHYSYMQLPQLVEAGRRAVTGLRKAGELWNLTDALVFLDLGYVFQGRFADSDELNQELEPLANRLGHMGAQVIARRNRIPKLAAQAAALGVLDELSLAQSAIAPSMGTHWMAYANTQRGIVHLWRGDWVRARTDMEEGARLAFPGTFWYGIHHGFLFLLVALCGERDVARNIFERFAALPKPGRGNTMGAWSLAALAAEGVGILGDTGQARMLHRLFKEDLARGTVIRQYDGALLERVAAMAAAAAGLHEQAEAHFETALHQAEELPHVMERPHVRHFYGRFLIERASSGDVGRAQALLDEAILGYRSIGMPRHVAMAEQLLKRV
jgi:tetratricopeptide (TPR) repeat protein